MQTIIHNKTFHHDTKLTIAIGNFDGVHRGHQKLIEKAKSYQDTDSALLTFDPHPISVLTKHTVDVLTSIKLKLKLLMDFNIDHIFVKKFSLDFASLSIREFIIFLKSLNVIRVIIGRDFHFSSKGSGSAQDLMHDFEVVVIPDELDEHLRISSSYIRSLLQEGQIHKASELLTRPYLLEGEVVHGNKVGRLLGFPTANIDTGAFILPKNGIYYVKVIIDDISYEGMANIGNNPTINFTDKRKLEVNILDFSGDLYQKHMYVSFIEYLRPELKFDSKEELIEQMKIDEKNVRNRLL